LEPTFQKISNFFANGSARRTAGGLPMVSYPRANWGKPLGQGASERAPDHIEKNGGAQGFAEEVIRALFRIRLEPSRHLK
jgi:hypothetical protein